MAHLPHAETRSSGPLTAAPLLSMSEIATLTQVKRPVVSTWRRRHADFPAPATENAGHPLFDGGQVAEWLVSTGPGNADPAELRTEAAPLFGIMAQRNRFGAWQLAEILGSLLCLRRRRVRVAARLPLPAGHRLPRRQCRGPGTTQPPCPTDRKSVV